MSNLAVWQSQILAVPRICQCHGWQFGGVFGSATDGSLAVPKLALLRFGSATDISLAVPNLAVSRI